MKIKIQRSTVEVIHHRLRTLLSSDRRLVISLVVAAGMLSSVILSQFPQDFEDHYIIGFMRSWVLFLLTFTVILYTYSIRLVGLSLLIVTSMFLDLIILTDHEVYDPLYDWRYGDIGFSKGFQVYEIMCFIFIFNRDDLIRIAKSVIILMGNIRHNCNAFHIQHFTRHAEKVGKN